MLPKRHAATAACCCDPRISLFRLAYLCNSDLPTELYLSERFRYPFGFNVSVTPQKSCQVSQPEANTGACRRPLLAATRACNCCTEQCTSRALRGTVWLLWWRRCLTQEGDGADGRYFRLRAVLQINEGGPCNVSAPLRGASSVQRWADRSVPSRGAIGYQSELRSSTRGARLLQGYDELKGATGSRRSGSLIPSATGTACAAAGCMLLVACAR